MPAIQRILALAFGICIVLCGLSAPQVAALSSAEPLAGEQARFSVTLITGDTVQVERLPGGKQAGTIKPGPGREAVRFQQQEIDGKLFVIPEDAMPYLSDKRLDRSLFDLTLLAQQGYTDAESPVLPLILRYRAEASLDQAAPAASSLGQQLASVHGRAVSENRSRATEFWHSISSPQVGAFSAGIEQVWLDRKVVPSLDRSVKQVGATDAWADGYDGSGASVAVLDTGYDPTHADLAGKVTAEANFTSSADIRDRFGHGTHVAATVAGTGAASSGKRKGVAPGARLLIGKVLGDDGSGYLSWVLAGMEWAARSSAKVVNMSLGAGPTDGNDPLSTGLDTLSERYGTLFVVAAGNDGSGRFTVGAPGTARSALTVGAVDRTDVIAPFSSRGPRIGDFAVKPDITAPGVGIVAARAAGTSLGTPVDDKYTALSGTSMATPHVAGAAAILTQRHPQWSARQLKDALASTAKATTGVSVFEQGGGRLDVSRAIRQGVYATGTLDLGQIVPGSVEFRKDITYTNSTAHPVTLTLALSIQAPGGGSPAAGAIRLDRPQVEILPGATTTVGITVSPDKLNVGLHSGVLDARTADGVVAVHTSLGLIKEAPRHKVTLTSIGRDGNPGWVPLFVLLGDDNRFDWMGYIAQGQSKTAEVAEGTYYLDATIIGGSERDWHLSKVINPALDITKDTALVLDARTASQIVINTPKPATQTANYSYFSHREFGSRNISITGTEFRDTRRVYVTPTDKVTNGTFEFGTRWHMAAPIMTATVLPNTDTPLELRYLGPKLKPPSYERRLPVVRAGAGQQADYAGLDVRGKIALVVKPAHQHPIIVARNAANAGAAMVIAVLPGAARGAAAEVTPLREGDDMPIPTALVYHDEGMRFAQLAESGGVSLLLRVVPDSPYLYDVMYVMRGQVPEDTTYEVSEDNSATIRAKYHQSGDTDETREQRFAWRPWQTSSLDADRQSDVLSKPQVRQEIVTADDTQWHHRVTHTRTWEDWNRLGGGMLQSLRRYEPGQQLEESWFAPVVRPAIPSGAGLASIRDLDTLVIKIPEFVDSQPGHYGRPDDDMDEPPSKVSASLYQNGKLTTTARDAWRRFPASAEPANYRLDLSVTRPSPHWRFATHTDTSWTFASQRPKSGQSELLPLLQLDYGVPAGLDNKLPAGQRAVLDLTGRYQDGLAGPTISQLQVWTSYDDGKTWVEAIVEHDDGRFQAIIDHPSADKTNGFVTLRAKASDQAGNTIDQTIVRAYGLR